MLTLQQREDRLCTFLREHFPNHHITASLLDHKTARNFETPHLPEMRVILSGSEGGLLRWKLEISAGSLANPALRRLGDEGLLTVTDQLIDLLANAVEAAPWRIANCEAGERQSDADIWKTTIEEAWTPAHRQPQRLFLYTRYFGVVLDSTSAGTNMFTVSEVMAPPYADEYATLHHADEDVEYLGPPEWDGTLLQTEYPARQNHSAPVGIYLWKESVAASEAAEETETHDLPTWRDLQFALSGLRFQKRTARPRYRLTLRFPLISEEASRQWVHFLYAAKNRAAMVLVRADQTVVEVSLLSIKRHVRPDGQPGALEIEFLAGEFYSSDAFAEVTT